MRILLYFDIFDHPLTFKELCAFSYAPETSSREAETALEELVARGILERSGDLYFLSGQRHTVDARKEKARLSQTLWKRVPMASSLLGSMPFVRGVMVTGSLAKDAAGPGADIDFLIFAQEGRVWICRSFINLFRKMLPASHRRYFCTNVYLSEGALRYDQQNVYIAVEIATGIPAHNPELTARFKQENDWMRMFLPGWTPPGSDAAGSPEKQDPRRGTLEKLLQGKMGDRLELLAQRAWERFWSRKYPDLAPEVRRVRFRVKPTLSTNHFHDFQSRTLKAYRDRLARYGIPGEP